MYIYLESRVYFWLFVTRNWSLNKHIKFIYKLMFDSPLGIDFVLMISLPVEQNVYGRVRQVGEN